MKYHDVDPKVVLTVIAKLGETFCTTDVSDDPDMLAAHAAFVDDLNYRGNVGKVLKRLPDDDGGLLLAEVESGGPKGSRWRRARGTAIS